MTTENVSAPIALRNERGDLSYFNRGDEFKLSGALVVSGFSLGGGHYEKSQLDLYGRSIHRPWAKNFQALGFDPQPKLSRTQLNWGDLALFGAGPEYPGELDFTDELIASISASQHAPISGHQQAIKSEISDRIFATIAHRAYVHLEVYGLTDLVIASLATPTGPVLNVDRLWAEALAFELKLSILDGREIIFRIAKALFLIAHVKVVDGAWGELRRDSVANVLRISPRPRPVIPEF